MKVLILLFYGSLAMAATPYSRTEREAYIQKVLTVLTEIPKQKAENINQFMTLVAQNKCQSVFSYLTLKCLYEEAAKNCKSGDASFRLSCPVISDVVLVNKSNEKQFLTKDERFNISEHSSNYAQGYTLALKRKYGMLTTEFLLLSKTQCRDIHSECFAKELDQYCIQNSDVKNLPWQGCVAAITWFIGEEK